jgi:catechol 2,3-dioxygenase-like lactoylglutathione lyase family enzyme
MNKPALKFTLLTVVLLLTLPSYPQSSQQVQPASSHFTSKLINLGVVVSDLDRSIDFYTNVIGMVKAYNFTINSEFSKRSGLADGDSASVTVLKLENSPEANEWKLMSFGKKATHPKQKFVKDDTGVQYITINVKALKPIIDRLKQRNIPLLGSTPTRLNTNSRFVLVQDPDGTFIELIGPMD